MTHSLSLWNISVKSARLCQNVAKPGDGDGGLPKGPFARLMKAVRAQLPSGKKAPPAASADTHIPPQQSSTTEARQPALHFENVAELRTAVEQAISDGDHTRAYDLLVANSTISENAWHVNDMARTLFLAADRSGDLRVASDVFVCFPAFVVHSFDGMQLTEALVDTGDIDSVIKMLTATVEEQFNYGSRQRPGMDYISRFTSVAHYAQADVNGFSHIRTSREDQIKRLQYEVDQYVEKLGKIAAIVTQIMQGSPQHREQLQPVLSTLSENIRHLQGVDEAIWQTSIRREPNQDELREKYVALRGTQPDRESLEHDMTRLKTTPDLHAWVRAANTLLQFELGYDADRQEQVDLLIRVAKEQGLFYSPVFDSTKDHADRYHLKFDSNTKYLVSSLVAQLMRKYERGNPFKSNSIDEIEQYGETAGLDTERLLPIMRSIAAANQTWQTLIAV